MMSFDTLIYLISLLDILYFLYWLIALTQTSSIVLNKSRKGDTLALSLILVGCFTFFSTYYNVGCTFGFYSCCYAGPCSPHPQPLRRFFLQRDVRVCSNSFLPLLKWPRDFQLCGDLCLLIYICWTNPCMPGMKSTWSQWMILLMQSWVWFSSNLFRIFAPLFVRKYCNFPFCSVFVWFGYQANNVFIKNSGSVSSFPLLWNNLNSTAISSSLKSW